MNPWPRLIERVRRRIATLPDYERGIVVAVSGGADSMALLRAALAARSEVTPIVVAHMNHGLRGPESDRDAEFVRKQSQLLNLRHEVGFLDVRLIAQQKSANLEATVRTERYSWLTQIALKYSALWIATGHNADDQAETVLLRLLRGTGLQGLRGIAERRPLTNGISLVRPLLQTTCAEILAALEEIGQPWHEDRY